MSKRQVTFRISILASVILSGLFLWLALRQVDAIGLAHTFAAIEFLPLLLSAAAWVGSSLLRPLWWRL